ncbi:MAG: hypothetical protein ACKOW9_03590 [Candidatus Paceibacterota bacterium]
MEPLDFKNHFLHLTILLFGLFTFWWIQVEPFDSQSLLSEKGTWSEFYWIFAAFAGLFGVFTSKEFGFTRSIIGRTVLAFSIGLLLQAIGQIIDAYLSAIGNADIFYPSASELGYAGSIFVYIYGAYLLARYVGISPSIKNLSKSVVIWLIPIAMFGLSYTVYLREYDFVNSSFIRIAFDFGYPILQSFYVALSFFVLIHSRNIAAGALRLPIAFLVTALILQYVADAYFVYDYNQGIWYNANLNDYVYLVSYFVLAVAIVYLDDVIRFIHGDTDDFTEAPEGVTPVELSEKYIELLRTIIKSQEEIIGPLVWTEVAQVSNIIVKDKESMDIQIIADPKATINMLLDFFFKVFGPTALYVAKRNTYRITKNMQMHQVPDRLL